MQLNTIKPAEGSKKNRRRVARGVGAGLGKTAGRGHNGQKSRSGYSQKVGFEGGQMPLQRRLPKRGFTSLMRDFRSEITVGELAALGLTDVDMLSLKAKKVIANDAKVCKVIAGGEIRVAVTLRGIGVTASAKKAIEAAGGKFE
ncbi:MAG: 50S ribosomal protein L15 [Betaproteobacteria bacterium]|nr:MAG: 50S ribosomal protein L15 [Betaproteobacteria bacterium]